MNTIGSIVGEFYPKLLNICEKRKISLNLDLENPSVKVFQEKRLRDFLTKYISYAVKNCRKDPDSHVAIIQKSIPNSNMSKFSIKFSGETLTPEAKQKLLDEGLEVRARFGYDTVVSIKL